VAKEFQQTRILIVADPGIFRDTLVTALAAENGFRIVAQFSTLTDAVGTLAMKPADVILVDFELRDDTGRSLITWAAAEEIQPQFLVMTGGLKQADAVWLIRQRVAGIFLKQNSLSELIAAVRAVAQGGNWLDQPFLKLVMETLADGKAPESGPYLTERERATLRFLSEGCTNKEIGSRLQVSEPAVKATVQRLFNKIGVRSRGHLIRIAFEKYPKHP
jgi:DNA-binding NarL/FixJ family response regulator